MLVHCCGLTVVSAAVAAAAAAAAVLVWFYRVSGLTLFPFIAIPGVFVEFDFVLPVGGLNDSFVDLERYPFGLTLVTCLFESWFVDLERYPFGLTLVT